MYMHWILTGTGLLHTAQHNSLARWVHTTKYKLNIICYVVQMCAANKRFG